MFYHIHQLLAVVDVDVFVLAMIDVVVVVLLPFLSIDFFWLISTTTEEKSY